MYRKLGQFIVRYRRWILPLVLMLAGFCALFVPNLEFNFTPQQFFKTDSNLGEYREQFADTFGREDNLLVVSISGGDVFEPETLGLLRNATLEIRRLDPVKRAESIATFGMPRSGDSPGSMTVDPLLDQQIQKTERGAARPVEAERAERLRRLAMQEPLVRGRLIGESGEAAVILAWLDDDIQEVSRLRGANEQIQQVLAGFEMPDGLRVRTGGVPSLRADIIESLRSEQLFFLPMTGLIYLIVLVLLFRRPSGVLLPVGVVLMAVAATVALMVWTGSSINIVNNVLPTVIFIIGIADSIHLLTRQAEEADGDEPDLEATRKMVETTGFACLMTSTTTAIGFISLVYADTAILKNFGWQAASGVMLAYFFTLFFLPPALAFLRPVRRPTEETGGSELLPDLEGLLMDLADTILDHPWRFIVGGLSVCGLFGWFATWVVIDTTILEVFQEDHPSYETTEYIEQNFGGFLPVEVSLKAKKEGQFKEPEVYRQLHRFQQAASTEEPVLSTQSIVDFHQSTRAALLGEPDERDKMPTSRAQIEQLHLLIAGAPDAETGPNQYITRDFSHARVLLRVADVGARRQMELADHLRDKLDKYFGKFDGISYRITGDAYVASVALDSFIRDLFYSLLFAGLIIFGIMSLMFRSLKIGVISILPNATPLLITFGYMGWAGINLNSSTIIIFAIGLGLAVDDTIHVLARFREELDKHPDDVRRALRETYYGAGRAIMLTSILLLVGLVILLFSDFIPTRQFGLLTSTTIAAAILGDLILLPPILYLVYRDED